MSTTRKTPKLRFPEFTDDWEQRKCGDVMKESRIPGHSGDVAKKHHERDLVCSVHQGYMKA